MLCTVSRNLRFFYNCFLGPSVVKHRVPINAGFLNCSTLYVFTHNHVFVIIMVLSQCCHVIQGTDNLFKHFFSLINQTYFIHLDTDKYTQICNSEYRQCISGGACAQQRADRRAPPSSAFYTRDFSDAAAVLLFVSPHAIFHKYQQSQHLLQNSVFSGP